VALPNADRYANEFQRKYDDIRQRFEVYGSASGLSHRWSDLDFDEMQRWVEAWLCRDMYNTYVTLVYLGCHVKNREVK